MADADLKTFELYNLREDVGETKNLADAEPDRLAQLAARLRAFRADAAQDRVR